MSLDGITRANNSLILKNPAFPKKQLEEENTEFAFGKNPVDSHSKTDYICIWGK